jgi:S-adenosylmethionine-diacylgycerolhomoserine-N-methlytransferase
LNVLPETDSAAAHMDAIYRYQRYIYNASRKYYLLGRDKLLDELAVPAGGSILEVGCGTGRNLVLAAGRYPEARLYGFDISAMMLETAEQSLQRAGLAGRARVAQADATSFDAEALFGTAQFDRVFISYALSMIPPWRRAIPEAMKAVAPGGSLHIVDFGQQTGLPKWFRTGLHAWLAKFSVEPRAGLEAELRKAAEAHNATLTFARLYRDYAQYAVLRRT